MIAKPSPRVLLLALLILAGLAAPAPVSAAVACPNPNPVADENNCHGPGTMSWRLTPGAYTDEIGGFSVRTSYDRGENVQLKIARGADAATNVDIDVYRTGWYGGLGARQISAASQENVPLSNTFSSCDSDPRNTGKLDCGDWGVTATIPGSALPASGVYVAKLRTDTMRETWIVFTVRDDARAAKLLFVLPVTNYQAYNLWGGKSLYFDKDGGPETVSGGGRAVKVSFNRPLWAANDVRNRYYEPDFRTVQWLERQGYDVSYSDDVQAHLDGAELRRHKVLIIPSHSEYWSLEQFQNIVRARDAGVSVASFSANTAYWKVRYEDGTRTLVCYKTVQGDGSGGSGAVTPNDPGPDGATGTADDALGRDGIAGTADDRPQNSTTTFRDNGAPRGDPNAPLGGRVGPDMPENMLFGVMYFGDYDGRDFALTVPAGNSAGEFSGDRIWRNTGLSRTSPTTIAPDYVGWEWDAVPTQAQYRSRQPAGVVRLSSSDTSATGSSWLQDEGRARNNVPPPGQPATVNAVRYRVPSGAMVFASGTIQWYRGLVPTNDSVPDARIQQATYNIFSDMGVQPLTPTGVTLDPPNRPPTAVATATRTSGELPLPVSFDGSRSTDPDALIARYDWDLDGDGAFDDGLGPRATFVYRRDADFAARLRVTDPAGASSIATIPIRAGHPAAPPAGGLRKLARISSPRLVRGRRLVLRVNCLAKARTACSGKATVTVRGVKAGQKKFGGLEPSRGRTLRVKLDRAARRRLRPKPVAIRIRLTVRDAAGRGSTARRTLRLR